MKLEKMNNELTQVKRDFTNQLEGDLTNKDLFNQLELKFYCFLRLCSESRNDYILNLNN